MTQSSDADVLADLRATRPDLIEQMTEGRIVRARRCSRDHIHVSFKFTQAVTTNKGARTLRWEGRVRICQNSTPFSILADYWRLAASAELILAVLLPAETLVRRA